jgi:hypothetical protein
MTYEEGLAIAAQHCLVFEYDMEIQAGCTPEEALREWDIN